VSSYRYSVLFVIFVFFLCFLRERGGATLFKVDLNEISRIVLQVNMHQIVIDYHSRVFDLMTHFQDGGYDVFHAEKCCHLVSAASAPPLCNNASAVHSQAYLFAYHCTTYIFNTVTQLLSTKQRSICFAMQKKTLQTLYYFV